VAVLCRKLFVTRAGYYAWKKRQTSERSLNNEALLKKILEVHQQSRETYGYPRVHAVLKKQGESCGRNRIARIMRDFGIKARMAKRFRKHSHRHHLIRDPRNMLLGREPEERINEVWVCDVTYVRVARDWNYLCTVMDRYSRKIVGWHFAKSLNAHLAMEAVHMAVQQQQPKPGLVFHTDRGIEFANKEFKALMDQHGMQISKSRKGCCWDNANMESFYHTLKTEMIYFHRFKDIVDALAHIMDYIRFYNNDRLHSSLNYESPATYEAMAA
jgi:transposase InsO family protein